MSHDHAVRALVCGRLGVRAMALWTVLRRASLEPMLAETRAQALRELHRGGIDAIMLGCYVRDGGVANVDRRLPMVAICAGRSFGNLVAELGDGIADRSGAAGHSGRGIGAPLRAMRLRRAYEQALARGGEGR